MTNTFPAPGGSAAAIRLKSGKDCVMSGEDNNRGALQVTSSVASEGRRLGSSRTKGSRPPVKWRSLPLGCRDLVAMVAGVALWGFCPPACAQVIYVNAAAIGANNGSSWADAYTKLQDALVAAGSGVQVWVARGVYYPDEGGGKTNDDRAATFQLLNGVAIYGGFAGTELSLLQRNPVTNITVLSGDIDKNDTTDANGVVTTYSDIVGNNSYQVVTGSGTNVTAILDGFTITGGLANGSTGPCVNVCGAGLFNNAGSPTLANLILSGNSSTNAGGGMANINSSSPTMSNITFVQNRAGQGGGMANLDSSSPTIEDCTFIRNLADVGGGGNGGGMFNLNTSQPQIFGAVFIGNEALVNGGGMMNQNSSAPVLRNVAFFGNKAGFGGGLYNLSSSNALLVNGVFSGNLAFRTGGGAGGGVLNNNSSPILTNVSFSGNVAAGYIQTAGGMLNGAGSNPRLTNVILWGNVAVTGKEMVNSGGSVPQVSFSLIEGSGGSGVGWNTAFGTDGGGNLDSDPLFVDPDGGDNIAGTIDDNLRLKAGSPAIDAGNNNALGLGLVSTDLDAALRFIEDPLTPDTGLGSAPIVDLGAFEFRRPYFARVPVHSVPGVVLAVATLLVFARRRLMLQELRRTE